MGIGKVKGGVNYFAAASTSIMLLPWFKCRLVCKHVSSDVLHMIHGNLGQEYNRLCQLIQPWSGTRRLGASREECLAAVMADLRDQSPEVSTNRLSFTQFTVSAERHSDFGCSACFGIVVRCCAKFIAGALSSQDLHNDDKMRPIYLEAVKECDSDAETCDGQYLLEAFRSQRVVLPMMLTWQQCIVSPEELEFLLCCCRPPHAIGITAFVASESFGHVSHTGNSLSILVSSCSMVCHDSHLGITIEVQGRGIRAAEHMVVQLFSVLGELGCMTSQLELVHCCVNPCDKAACEKTVSSLMTRVPDNGVFLKSFCKFAPILISRWGNRLHEMGDVQVTFAAYAKLRQRSYVVGWLPCWFLPSMFFVLHQLRFSFLMDLFVEGCLERSTLWVEADETEFERILQQEMPVIVNEVVKHWDEYYAAGVVDSEYSVERALIPSMYLQYCSGYGTFYLFFTSCTVIFIKC